jgi:uncharacterized protein (DUF58 family)
MSDDLRQALIDGEIAGARYRLAPPDNAPGGLAGAHLGQGAGSSLEFMEHRTYQPGDDIRQIDWSAYARTDRLIVKQYRREVVPHLDLALDASASMALPGSGKPRASLALAALLACAAERAGYTHRLWLARDRIDPVAASDAPPSQWPDEVLHFRGKANPEAAMARTPPPFRPRGVRILVSDLLWAGDPAAFVKRFAAGAATTAVVQVLARADADPQLTGEVRLVDSETGLARDLTIDDAALARVRRRLTDLQTDWARATRRVGGVFCPVTAETFLADWRLPELTATELLKVS